MDDDTLGRITIDLCLLIGRLVGGDITLPTGKENSGIFKFKYRGYTWTVTGRKP